MAVGRLRLITSIHDVSPRFEAQVDRLHERLARHVGVAGMAMLVVPDHWGMGPIVRGSGFATRLRRWSDAGIEMFVHGWYHRDHIRHAGLGARLRAGMMTAGEGEFLGLDEAEAARRMADGRALIEDVIGRRAAGFIAPAWLYGDGALRALGHAGYDLAEDHMRVWSPATGRVLSRGPVITWASRSNLRALSSRLVAALGRQGLGFLPTLRVAVHPGDTTRSDLEDSIETTLARLRRTRAVGRYSDLLAAND